MEPIFDASGDVVAWRNDKFIHDMSGHAFAFLQNEALYLYSTEQIGWLRNGYYRDFNGDAVAFHRGCHGGPLAPLTKLPPLPPMPHLPSLPPLAPLSPLPPLFSLNWSDLTWEEYVGWE